MTLMVLAGLLAGTASVVLVRTLRPGRPPVPAEIGGARRGLSATTMPGAVSARVPRARAGGPGESSGAPVGTPAGPEWWTGRRALLGSMLAGVVRRAGVVDAVDPLEGQASLRNTASPGGARSDRAGRGEIAQWLAVTGMSLEDVCAESAVAAVAGFFVVPICWVMLDVAGLHVSIVLPIWTALVLGATGTVLPFLVLRSQAAARRRHVRRVTASFLDLVVLALAGGMGVEGALDAASQVGDDWAMRRIADVLSWARDAGVTPWAALGRLGAALGVCELEELAASVSLAGMEGAKVRQSLAAKAASVRRREQADAESAANAVTERMFLPGVLLLIGFLLFIGYPAFIRVFTGL